MQPRTVTAAIYLRVSTIDQGSRGFSIPEQRKACLEKAQALVRGLEAEHGRPIRLETAEFVDTAGGDVLERPELERVRAFVKEIRPAYFICLDPDRFSRATYQAIMVANEIEAAGTRLEFVQHDYQATSEGRLFFTLRVAIAEYEKAKILERTSRGKRGKAAAGGIPHFISAYGYRYLPDAERQIQVREGGVDQGALVPDPAEAPWVSAIFQWVADERIGSQAVAERLNQLGVPAKRGGAWQRSVVADLLRNPLYIGQLRLNRWDFTGLGKQLPLPREKRTRKITPRERPPAEWIVVPVPAIISEELFQRAQDVLAEIGGRRSQRRHAGRGGHLLSGVARCGLCGAPVHYAWNNRVNAYLLRCANRYPGARGQAPCRLPYQRAGPHEERVWSRIMAWLSDPGLATVEPPPEDQARERMEEAKARQARILHLVSKGVVLPDVAEAQLGEIKRHLECLEQAAGAPRGELLADLDSAEHRQALVRLLIREVRIGPVGAGEIVPIS